MNLRNTDFSAKGYESCTLIKNEYLFIYFGLRWVFVAACGLPLVAASGVTLHCGARASHCGGFSSCGVQALGTRASVVVAHGLSCSTAYGIFLNEGSNLCVLCIGRRIFNHWTTREVLK